MSAGKKKCADWHADGKVKLLPYSLCSLILSKCVKSRNVLVDKSKDLLLVLRDASISLTMEDR